MSEIHHCHWKTSIPAVTDPSLTPLLDTNGNQMALLLQEVLPAREPTINFYASPSISVHLWSCAWTVVADKLLHSCCCTLGCSSPASEAGSSSTQDRSATLFCASYKVYFKPLYTSSMVRISDFSNVLTCAQYSAGAPVFFVADELMFHHCCCCSKFIAFWSGVVSVRHRCKHLGETLFRATSFRLNICRLEKALIENI